MAFAPHKPTANRSRTAWMVSRRDWGVFGELWKEKKKKVYAD
jgi:hypothetical protein